MNWDGVGVGRKQTPCAPKPGAAAADGPGRTCAPHLQLTDSPPGPSASPPDLCTAAATHQDPSPPSSPVCSISPDSVLSKRAGTLGIRTGRRKLDSNSLGRGQSARCLPGSNVRDQRPPLWARTSNFGDRAAAESISLYRGRLELRIAVASHPPAFHASGAGGQIIPQRASCQSPRAFSRAESFDSLSAGSREPPYWAPEFRSNVPLKGPEGTLCPFSCVCMTPDPARPAVLLEAIPSPP